MSNIQNSYETIFILDTTKGEEAVNEVAQKFKSLIEANATIDSVDVWGKRRLAYPINDLTEGFYTLINFTANADFPAELERIYNITDGVLRSIVIKKGA